VSQAAGARDAPRYYLGVDGGGTKTAFAVASTDGGLLGEVTGEGTDYAARGLAAVEQTLRAGVEEVCRRAGVAVSDVTGAIFGLPGHGEDPVGTAELDRLAARLAPEGRGRCVNDVVCGWAGSLGLEDGVDVVAGTGSVA
jgi:N-acetylglucosamine kinase-like BadF-type ATPase